MKHGTKNRERRHKRVRAKVYGTASRPRLSVFRSNRFVYAQVIDDTLRRTLVGMHSHAIGIGKQLKKKSMAKSDVARVVGRELAQRVLAKNIKRVVFDRGGYRYHGRIRALAEGAREGGLVF